MRRLAKQSRDDKYSSFKDYQTLHERQGLRIIPDTDEGFTLVLEASLTGSANTTYVAFGGFFFPSSDITLTVELAVGSSTASRNFSLGRGWNRLGILVDALKAAEEDADAREIVVRLTWPSSTTVSFWGVTAGSVHLPEIALLKHKGPSHLQKSHLAPETFYLLHDEDLALEIDEEQSSRLRTEPGEEITVKKCAYCSRFLPLDPNKLGSLSFHMHKKKKTSHQNECRVCKAWRINRDFNPKRTIDQLHESSVITRERKIFLREPEILQKIKDRTGAGLKSQVWKRFGCKCFYCERPLKLKEVQLDHTRPVAYLWPIDEHATCLCADHNNQKKDKFPVDFYNDEQLRRLSEICGLPYEELRKKKVNEVELERILADLPTFARQWDSKTFASVTRKVRELRPDVDLLAILQGMDADAYIQMKEDLQQRPSAVGEDDIPIVNAEALQDSDPSDQVFTLFDLLDQVSVPDR